MTRSEMERTIREMLTPKSQSRLSRLLSMLQDEHPTIDFVHLIFKHKPELSVEQILDEVERLEAEPMIALSPPAASN